MTTDEGDIRATCEQHRATIEQWVRTKPYYQVLQLPMTPELKRVDEGMPIGAATMKIVSVRLVRVGRTSTMELLASCEGTTVSLGKYQP
jgi:hypothetical protein